MKIKSIFESKKKQFCPQGHDTFLMGREERGYCSECKRVNNRTYKRGEKPPKQFCKHGHDTFVYGREKSNGQCTKCKRNYQKEYYKNNIEKMINASHKTYKRNKKSLRVRMLLIKYNITIEDYDKMFKKQRGKCLGCLKDQSQFKKAFAVDHDHSCCSGKTSCGKCIRGLLCQLCNLVIGNANNDVKTLKRLIRYLQK